MAFPFSSILFSLEFRFYKNCEFLCNDFYSLLQECKKKKKFKNILVEVFFPLINILVEVES